MKIIMETERLIMREWLDTDANAMFELNSDPEVMQFTGDVYFESEAHALELIQNYDQYEKYKLGRWACILKSDASFVGWCGLKYLVEDDVVDVGYRFFKRYWNQGFATESAIASLKYGFETLNLKHIVAHAMIENKASERVMQKIGMSFVGPITMDGFAAVQYEIHNPGLKTL